MAGWIYGVLEKQEAEMILLMKFGVWLLVFFLINVFKGQQAQQLEMCISLDSHELDAS